MIAVKKWKITLKDGAVIGVDIKDDIFYPTPEFVLWLHEEVANEGLRDIAGLEVICYKVQDKKYATVLDKASFLLYSIATTHPFFNGNKRTALAAALVFLAINDYGVDILKHYNDEETMKFILEIAEYKKSRKEVRDFLERKLKN